MTMVRRDRPTIVTLYVSYAAILVVFLMPLAWLVSLSIRTPAEFFDFTLRLVPSHPTLQNVERVVRTPYFFDFLWNGILLALLGSGGALCVATPAAYAFSRFRFRGKDKGLIAVLCFLMMSPLLTMIPLYQYLQRLGLTENVLGAALIYVVVALPVSTWTLKFGFDSIPTAIDEAAMIDGCSRFAAFFRIVLPLAVPAMAATFVLSTSLGWSQFVVPFILLSRPDTLPIAVGIYNFLSTYNGSATQLVAAAGLISVLPPVMVFLVTQRPVVGALMGGALKE